MPEIQKIQLLRHAFGSYAHVSEALAALPQGQRWIDHIEHELMPYWETEIALGNPLGAFPTYRHDDGSAVDLAAPGLDIKRADPGVVDLAHPIYTRMHGRQTFAYGVAFHLTGNRKYLNYAKAGVDYFRNKLIDRACGGAYANLDRCGSPVPISAYTYLDQAGAPGPTWRQRRSQDLAYALCGIGFYYYLTRDPSILDDIVAIKNHIFKEYYDPGRDLIRWVIDKGNPDDDKPWQKELVAQLDQVYAYLLFVTPALPDPKLRQEWYKDLDRLGKIMLNQFYSPRTRLFWGSITDACEQRYGAPHTDFGHSVKTFWLLHQLGKMLNDVQLSQFCAARITQILDESYLWDDGTWSRGFRVTGDIDPDKEWWIFAELDQAAGTLALVDPSYVVYLPRAHKYWFEHMVDHQHKEIWHYVNAGTNAHDPRFPKQHSWKNAFHSTEHALVSYLTTQQVRRQEIKLHYAFTTPPPDETIRPYTFQGRITDRPGPGQTAYTFKDLR